MNYNHIQQINEEVNCARRNNRLVMPYITFIIANASGYLKELAEAVAVTVESFDALLCKGYLDSGYDDNDPRWQTDHAFDRWQDNERARCGSTAAEAAEAEIAFTIAHNRAQEELSRLICEIDGLITDSNVVPAPTPCDCGCDGCDETIPHEFWDANRDQPYTLANYLAAQREAEMEYHAHDSDWN